MKFFRKIREGDRRIISICGLRVFSYRKKGKISPMLQQAPAVTQNSDVAFGTLWAALGPNLAHLASGHDALKQLVGRQILETRKIRPPTGIADAEFQVFSQWGEDGIIQWMISRIPNPVPVFIEFGVENFMESNTRFLLVNNSWRGLVIDGSKDHMAFARSRDFYWRQNLTAVDAFIDKDNINDLFRRNGFTGEIGILSVDLDGNDYWILKEIDCVNPQFIICEINGVFGNKHAVTIPYKADFQRLAAHHSGQYFGASLKAMELLLTKRGYSLIGVNTSAVNAFFVRNDLAGHFEVTTSEKCRVEPGHSDTMDENGKMTFIRGNAGKLALIKDMPLQDVASGRTAPVGEIFLENGE